MSALKPGSCLRTLVLTPQKIPRFIIPSRSPRFASPRPRSPDRTRLLSDPEEDAGPARSPPAAGPAPLGVLLRQPRSRTPREAAAADTDLSTRAAMSLPHVDKVTAPYGFGAVLAASPCTRRRESLFHRSTPGGAGDLQDRPPAPATPRNMCTPPAPPGRSRVGLRPVRAFGLQVMRELKRPAAALKALSPAHRGAPPL
ncbi:C2 calcium-dependent domain-containing protein 4A-like [Etheostoma cragini]|uniref:C2 calcium-dependent domain-containing protein 4A-like n=1 Tax=Etheostoma cragini TaxID=417921 RepID=UPI00155EBDEE|nr:C2 calcium-dependent domain-containing protein 4A-like [Etheostoma cragini]